MKRIAFYFCLVLGISVSLFACKKKAVAPDDKPVVVIRTLVGLWEETSNSEYRRRIIFLSDGSFEIRFIRNGSYSLTMEGNYIVVGSSLKMTVLREIKREGTSPEVITQVNTEIFEKATYSIEGNVLTLKYISYPADGPVETELKLNYRTMPG